MTPNRLGELPEANIARLLQAGQLELDVGPLRFAVRSDVSGLAGAIKTVYGAYPCPTPAPYVDIRVALFRVQGLRRFLRPQIQFFADGNFPFEPFHAANHLPFVEWGVNWTIAHRSNNYLLLHAGVVEKHGRAVILSALPGSGKSTLTAAMTCNGFRLFSDEFGVMRTSDQSVIPLLRPIALKNESVAVIRGMAPNAVIGPLYRGTRKGDVAHMAPDVASVDRMHEPAAPALIIFPKYEAGAATRAELEMPSRAFSRLSVNSFNYALLGPVAFSALADLVERCKAYRLVYSDLTSAIATIEQLLTDD